MSSEWQYLLDSTNMINGKYSIKDLLAIEKLRDILEDFSSATGFAIGLVSQPDQELLIDAGDRDICLKFHRALPESERHCKQSNQDLTKNLNEKKIIEIRRCKNGLVNSAVPIIVKGVHIANLCIKQIFIEKPDIEHFRKQGEAYGYNVDAYLKAVADVPIISKDKLEKALASLCDMVTTIAEQRNDNLELKEERDKFKSIYNQSFHLIGLMALDGTLVHANQTALDFGGLQPSDVFGKPFWETPWWTHSPEQQETLRKAVEKAAEGKIARFEASHPSQDGTEVCIDFSITPMKDETGNVILLIPEGHEITERVWAEKALNEEKRFSETALNSLPGLFYVFDEEGVLLRWNKNLEDVSGYSHEEVAAMNSKDFFASEDQELTIQTIRGVFEHGQDSMDNLFLTKSGKQIPHHFKGLRTLINDKPYLIGTAIDITSQKRAEDELQKSRALFFKAFNSSPSLMSISTIEDGHLLEVNEAFCRTLGYRREEVLGRTAHDFNLYEDKTDRIAFARMIEDEGRVNSLELRVRTKSGEVKTVLVGGAVIEIDGQNRLLVSAEDITQRKQAEEERLAHTAFLENMNRIDQAIRGTTDLDQMMKDVLDTVYDIFECDRVWLLYPCDPDAPSFRVPMEISHPDYPGATISNHDVPMTSDMAAYCRSALANDGPVAYGPGNENPLLEGENNPFGVQSQMFMSIHSKLGSPWVFGMHQCSYPRIWSQRDKTLMNEIGRRLADGLSSMLIMHNLKESEEKYRLLFENADIFISIYDKNGVCLMMNQTAAKSLGGGSEDLIGKTFEEQHFEEAAEYTNRIREIIETGDTRYYTDRINLPDGVRYLSSNAMPVKDARGDIYAAMIISQDITERKQAEEALRESEEKFRLLSDQSLLGIHIIMDGRIDYINDTSCEIIEYSRDEVLNWDANEFGKIIHPEDLPFVMKQVKMKQEGCTEYAVNYQWRLITKSGIVKNIESWSKSIAYKGKIADFVMMMDITNRIQAEEALRQSEETFRALAENNIDTIMRFDRGHRHLYVNPIVEMQTGLSPEQFIGKTHKELGFPEDLCRTWEEAINVVFETGNVHRIEFQLPNGAFMDWLLMPETGNDGQIVAVITSARDITVNKRAEEDKSRLEDQLRQSQKMESIGRLAGGVAHDFNNILTGINGFAEMIIASLEPDHPLRADMEEIKSAGERAAGLTNQLLAFSRKQIIAPKVIRPNEILERSQKMLRRIIGEDIDLVFMPGRKLGQIKMDPAQLDQILVNLAVNARDAMPSGGKLTIETQNVTLQNESVFVDGEVIKASGDYIMMSVSDSGHGMDSETIKHIFEPFFSTKEKGKGTGLGLATVYGIARQNNGFITVYSEPKLGTTFKIYLPQMKKLSEAPDKELTEQVHGGNETILLVEDEDMVRNLARKILSKYGYQIIEANNGEEAFLACENHSEEIHMLLTDVIMPGMNGRELYEKICAIKPEIKVLYMSGYTENAIAHHGVLDEDTEFLQKPFTIKTMTQKVRELLDK